jgi:hypothetical protein
MSDDAKYYYGWLTEVGQSGQPIDPGYGQGRPMPPHVGGGPMPGNPPHVGGGPMPGNPPHVGGGPMPGNPPHVGGGPMPGTPPVDPGWSVGHPMPPHVGGGLPITLPPIATLPIAPGAPPIAVQPLPPQGYPPSVTSGKPGGIPIVAPPAGATAPTAPPQPPGSWVTIDAGKGQPPAWGYIPHPEPPDHGLEPEPKPTGTIPPPSVGAAGHWVSVGAQPKGDAPVGPDSGKTGVWAWVPEIGKDFGTKPPESSQPKTGNLPPAK